MELHEVKILRKTKLAENEWRFDFDAPALCAEAVPGQFVMVETSHGPTPFLRRGIGKAPFEYLTDALLAKGNRLTFIVGGRSAAQLAGLEPYAEKNVRLLYATEDGSLGEKGFVSAYFDAIKDCDRIAACGPTPMLAAVKRFADEAGIPCQLSLEGKMACGVGVCLGCTCKSGNPDAAVYPKVCQDGPVFWSEEVELA